MHISTANIPIVTDRANIAITIKLEVAFGHSICYLYLTLAYLNVKVKYMYLRTFRLLISWKLKDVWQTFLLPSNMKKRMNF